MSDFADRAAEEIARHLSTGCDPAHSLMLSYQPTLDAIARVIRRHAVEKPEPRDYVFCDHEDCDVTVENEGDMCLDHSR